MLSGIEIGTALGAVSKVATAAKATEQLLKQINTLSEELKPFKADIKSFRIDYVGRNSEIKYLLLIPDGLKRQLHRKVEIPAVTGFRFYEMWDLDTMQTVASPWAFNGEKWILDATKLPSSEKYWLTVKGRVSQEFLDQLVSVKAAENPSRVQENDIYWIHSALKNVEAFEKIWTALNIEQVNAEVRIGVERMFTSAIPQGIRDRLELQQKLLDAITSGNRDEEQRLKIKYRTSKAKISPSEINQLLLKLVSGEYFADYVQVQDPFVVNNIEPIKEPGLIVPEKVKVGVLTDLNYNTPTAKGNLCFNRHKYSQSVAEKVKELLPKEKKTK
jgi:hypothetical protein